MAEECAVCGGELAKEDLGEEAQEKLKRAASQLEEDDDVHALVCQDCGHVAYRRS